MDQPELLELEHSIGYCGRHPQTLIYDPLDPTQFVYNNGGLVVVENLNDKHKQEFMRGHDMEISAMALSNSGKMLATGQLGTIF